MNVIYINESSASAIKTSAIERFPEECCGFLWGQGNHILVTKEVKNIAGNSEEAFRVSHLDYQAAEEFADRNGLSLLGVYHSHPNSPAIPSDQDIKHAIPYFINLILSVTMFESKEIRCWHMDRKQVLENKLKIKEYGNNLNSNPAKTICG
ncbi:MAG: M67 family peptidase [Pedobacter sp.]|nr:MAG: M67 family peptidase [Pedobacter sp.]